MAITINATSLSYTDYAVTTAPTFKIGAAGSGASIVANNNNGTGNVQFKILVAGVTGSVAITTTSNVVTITGS